MAAQLAPSSSSSSTSSSANTNIIISNTCAAPSSVSTSTNIPIDVDGAQHRQHQQQNSRINAGNAHSHSQIREFYAGKTVFITGGTGFMGKVLLEKLLRSCAGVHRIYLLIRPKRGQTAYERLQNLLCSPLFDAIRKSQPSSLSKVQPIEGDITEEELAISLQDRQMLARCVNIVFHSAATVKFDEKLKISVTINMLGTKRLVKLCERMTNLEALVHVSTAYCNCDRDVVDEVIYPPPISPEHVMALVEHLDESLLDQCTGHLVGRRPNTYTFTKALAECWLLDNQQQRRSSPSSGPLPLVIVRPSIVLSSAGGPLHGWVDNLNGPTGIIAAAGKGIFRTMQCDPDKVADVVPVDVVINLMITAAWNVAKRGGALHNQHAHQQPQAAFPLLLVYNCSTGARCPITWKHFIELCFKYMRRHPFTAVHWYPNGTITPWRPLDELLQWWMHWLPAQLMDASVRLCGGKPIMVNIYQRLLKASTCLRYFTMRQWRFHDDNVKRLSDSLSPVDRAEFGFDVATLIDWDVYIENYVLGIRRYIFKEDAATLERARHQMARLYWLHRSVQLCSVLFAWYGLTARYPPLRHLWAKAVRFLLAVLLKLLPMAN